MKAIIQAGTVTVFALISLTLSAHEHGQKAASDAGAKQTKPMPNYQVTQLTESLSLLQGRGGNIVLSVGEDGAVLIDDDVNAMSEVLAKQVNKLAQKPVKFVINTHWHFDHTGSNQALGEQGAMMVAHDNVRKRLAEGGQIPAFNTTIKPAGKEALPVITFDEEVSIHVNGDTLRLEHMEQAHTDGDAVVFFEKSNLVHMGDLYFAGMYPFIDAHNGGSLEGLVEALEDVLEEVDDETVIVPGHGPVSNKKKLVAYQAMLADIYKTLKQAKQKGLTVEEVIKQTPTAQYDKQYGGGFFKPDAWLKVIYPSI